MKSQLLLERNMQPNSKQSVVGWDIGGAHVKVANVNRESISNVYQLACPLWKGMNELSVCIEKIKKWIDCSQSMHAVTMTGELVDHFQNRKQGVRSIIDEMTNKLPQSRVKYFAGDLGFIDSSYAVAAFEKVASANWLASAQHVANKMPHAFFIDIGSTTTDIISINDNKVIYEGYSDAQRLTARELVYCGVVRTPIFALSSSAMVKGQRIPIINEYFSNMADVYRITKELPEHADLSETLDGRAKDILSSAKRLARMFAYDAKPDELEIWHAVAIQVRTNQIQMIKDACRHQLMKKNIPLSTPIVGAGVGRFLVKSLAVELGREYIDFESLFNTNDNLTSIRISDCAPAAAVAYLAMDQE